MNYFDANYISRCYLDEHGSTEVRALASATAVVCVELGQAEASSAFHRKLREGALTPAEFAALMNQFEAELSLFTWLPVTSALITDVRQSFVTLPPTVFLRSADALHLACAREAGLTEIYSNDRHLLAAAPHFGLNGVNVIPAPSTESTPAP